VAGLLRPRSNVARQRLHAGIPTLSVRSLLPRAYNKRNIPRRPSLGFQAAASACASATVQDWVSKITRVDPAGTSFLPSETQRESLAQLDRAAHAGL
jgi:hypothetical protein